MRLVRQVLPGLFIALLSVVIIGGVMVLSFAEEGKPASTRTPTLPVTSTMTRPLIITATPSDTSLLSTGTFTPSSSPSPSPTGCPPPEGWVPYEVKSGDTAEGLAAKYQTSLELLLQANCLVDASLLPGSQIHVPPLPTPTSTECGAPPDWVIYIVQRGDTLYGISRAYGITVQELQLANCMGKSILLVTGKKLYVPPWGPTPPTPTYPIYYTETPTWTAIVPDTPTPDESPTDYYP